MGRILRLGQAAMAARYQGFFPVDLEHPDQLAELVAELAALRREADANELYDIVPSLPPGTDPVPYADAGATWWAVEFPPEALSVALVRAVIRDGPVTQN